MKIAYLIIAHNELKVLNELIKLLDWPGNTIHILLDSESSISREDIFKETTASTVIVHTPGINIAWGGSSLIEAELYLLKQTFTEHYDYYCLLSGVDIPIKTQSYIHKELEENQGTEFIGVDKGWIKQSKEDIRYRVYHPLQNIIGKKNQKRYLLRIIERLLVQIQKPLINRQGNTQMQFEGGSQWFCITHSFCLYILSKEKWIRDTFKFTQCCDEVFLQTLLVNSDYYSHIYKPNGNCYEQCRRMIDFDRGRPYVWRCSDFNELMSSDAWFARKFSESVDMNIVNMISERIGAEQNISNRN